MTVRRSFVDSRHAWWRDSVFPLKGVQHDVMIAVHDGREGGEFPIEWVELTVGTRRTVPRLTVYSDSLSAMVTYCPDLLDWIARQDGHAFSADELCAWLRGAGFEDVTPRTSPHERVTS